MEYENILIDLIEKDKYDVFLTIKKYIEEHAPMEQIFKEQKVRTKKWKYELKFVQGRKTFCGFYFADHCLGFMLIFGKEERNQIEQVRKQFSSPFLKQYDETETYHDGKWLMLELEDLFFFEDIKKLLMIKSKPNKK